jgi:hypothetical protein
MVATLDGLVERPMRWTAADHKMERIKERVWRL